MGASGEARGKARDQEVHAGASCAVGASSEARCKAPKREATHVIEVDGRVRHRQCRWTASNSEWSRRRPRPGRRPYIGGAGGLSDSEWPRRRSRHGGRPGIGDAGGLEVVVSGRDVDLTTGEDLASATQVDWKWAGSCSEWPRRGSRHGGRPGIGDAGGLEVVVSGRDVDLATGEDLASEAQVDWK
eukprot:scaffold89797_cov36-Phaeocystis_antarctica.AAC.1